jgi:hypothetical protein
MQSKSMASYKILFNIYQVSYKIELLEPKSEFSIVLEAMLLNTTLYYISF